MADIVLIQPSAGVIDSMRTAHSLPLGLLSAATLAMEEFDVVLIDTRCEKGWRERLLEALARKPLLSGVTAVTGSQILSARKIASFVKAHSDTPVVWGGVHPTLLPEQTLRDPLVDLVVHGKGRSRCVHWPGPWRRRRPSTPSGVSDTSRTERFTSTRSGPSST